MLESASEVSPSSSGSFQLTVIGHVEVEIAVVVIVEERPAGGPVGPVDPGRLADIRKVPSPLLR